ncbi:MAG: transglycosylase domain-containing protein [Bacteroidaceae bacterium]|nr:transglycosylase domain-containing protein [Bacteroidaceae bacterium]
MFSVKHCISRLYAGPLWLRSLKWLLTISILLVLLVVAVDVNFLWLFGRSPGYDDICRPQLNEASLIYSADSVLIGRYYDENRIPVRRADLSDTLINTLIDTEDERFHSHHGVDFLGIFSAFKDAIMGSPRGGSTITQQLAKNMFRTRSAYSSGLLGRIPGVKLLIIKLKEMIVATKLERKFSKDDILVMYLNTVDFGSHAFGINTAAQTYFGCLPSQLTTEQCATLVGLLKATNTFNPYRNPANALARRNLVLQNLYDHSHMYVRGRLATKLQLDSLMATPLLADERPVEETVEEATSTSYFRQALRDNIADLCRLGLIDGYDEDNIIDVNTAGLKIHTTIDTRMQRMAQEAVDEQMEIIQKRFEEHWRYANPWRDEHGIEIPDFIENLAKRSSYYRLLSRKHTDQRVIDSLMNVPHKVRLYGLPDTAFVSTMDSIRHMIRIMHCGFVAIEPGTRQIKAWVGDMDWNFWQYDKVLAQRQPGSTFKLFVYAEAMNQGLTPVDTRLDAWHAYNDTVDNKPKIWAPHNANGYFSDLYLPLKSAFAQSINSVAVSLGYELTPKKIVETAHAMGIETPLDCVPSIALGSSDVNLLELTNSYATVIADGMAAQPVFITKIEDFDGNVIYEAPTDGSDPTLRKALPYRSAFYMQQLLRGGMTEPGGTTAALWQYIHPVASLCDFGGKTGTSNNHSDAWFVGVSPALVGGAWVGGEQRCIHFRTGELGQGSRTALPIFGRFMNKLLQDERFAHYRQHFDEKPKEDIPVNTYRGPSVYAGPPADSTDVDYPSNNWFENTTVGGDEPQPAEQPLAGED